MVTPNKSALDGIPVDDRAFPLGGSSTAPQKHEEHQAFAEVVGNCPVCGAPIYGQRRLVVAPPRIARTCACLHVNTD